MSHPDCTDVCETIMSALAQLGFHIDEDEDHTDILNALAKCKLVKDVKGPEVLIIVEGGVVTRVGTAQKHLNYRIIDIDAIKHGDPDLDESYSDEEASPCKDIEAYTQRIVKSVRDEV